MAAKPIWTALCLPVVGVALFPPLVGSCKSFTAIVSAQHDDAGHPEIAVAGLRCVTRPDGMIDVELGRSNANDQPAAFRAASVDLVLGFYGTGSPHDTFDCYDDRQGLMTADDGSDDNNGSNGNSPDAGGLALIEPYKVLRLHGTTMG